MFNVRKLPKAVQSRACYNPFFPSKGRHSKKLQKLPIGIVEVLNRNSVQYTTDNVLHLIRICSSCKLRLTNGEVPSKFQYEPTSELTSNNDLDSRQQDPIDLMEIQLDCSFSNDVHPYQDNDEASMNTDSISSIEESFRYPSDSSQAFHNPFENESGFHEKETSECGSDEQNQDIDEDSDEYLPEVLSDEVLSALNNFLTALKMKTVTARELSRKNTCIKSYSTLIHTLKSTVFQAIGDDDTQCCENELANCMAEKFKISDKKEKLQILSCMPLHWSFRKIMNIFKCGKKLIMSARDVQSKFGIHSTPTIRSGPTALNKETINLIHDFLREDSISRVMPGTGRHHCITIKNRNGKSTIQKRLLLCSIEEAFREFLEKHPDSKVKHCSIFQSTTNFSQLSMTMQKKKATFKFFMIRVSLANGMNFLSWKF